MCISASASYQYKEAKTWKLWSKSRCWEAWRRRWWSVSARRWVIGDKISVWPDFGQAGATLPARSEELSLPIVRREGRRGRILACLSCHTVTGHKAPRKQLFCSINSTSALFLLSWGRTIRNRNGDIRAFSAPIVWSWVKQTEDWSVFLSRRHEVSGSWVTRIRRRRNNSPHFRILLFKLLPKLDIEIELSESDLMLWDCKGLGENSAVLTKSAQKLPVLTKQHPHWLDKAYPHQKHFDRCCNSRSENFHFPMCYKAVFNQWNWIEFFERLVRSTFVKTSYKEENVLFSGAAMQCEN